MRTLCGRRHNAYLCPELVMANANVVNTEEKMEKSEISENVENQNLANIAS